MKDILIILGGLLLLLCVVSFLIGYFWLVDAAIDHLTGREIPTWVSVMVGILLWRIIQKARHGHEQR